MPSRHTYRWLASTASTVLIALALLAGVLEAASIPHAHSAGQTALFNEEHELSALATLNSTGLLPATPTIPMILGEMMGPPVIVRRLTWTPLRSSDSRAPPTR